MKDWYLKNKGWINPILTAVLASAGTLWIMLTRVESKIDLVDTKLEWLTDAYKAEKKNIYDLFHDYHIKIKDIDSIIVKK